MAGVGRDGNASVDTGVEATRGMHLSKQLPFPSWCDQAPGGIHLTDLPLNAISGENTVLKHFVDIIYNVSPPDKSAIEDAVSRGKWSRDDLLEPFCLKSEMEVTLVSQFAVLPQRDGSVCVLKHMYQARQRRG